MDTEPVVLTIPEVAKFLRVSETTAYEMAAAHAFPVIAMGRRSVRVPRVPFLAWLTGDYDVSDGYPNDHDRPKPRPTWTPRAEAPRGRTLVAPAAAAADSRQAAAAKADLWGDGGRVPPKPGQVSRLRAIRRA